MALQLGALRDALLAAQVPSEAASAAAEEVAGYENRLTRLTTMTQLSIGILVLLLGSQAALWSEVGHLNSEVSHLNTGVVHLNVEVEHLNTAVLQMGTEVGHLNDALLHITTQVDQISRAVVH